MESHTWPGIGLSDGQYGFRSGRSTDDARHRSSAISLHIRNAVNTIGWWDVMDFRFSIRIWESERRICATHDVCTGSRLWSRKLPAGCFGPSPMERGRVRDDTLVVVAEGAGHGRRSADTALVVDKTEAAGESPCLRLGGRDRTARDDAEVLGRFALSDPMPYVRARPKGAYSCERRRSGKGATTGGHPCPVGWFHSIRWPENA